MANGRRRALAFPSVVLSRRAGIGTGTKAETVRMGVCKERESIIKANDGIQGKNSEPL